MGDEGWVDSLPVGALGANKRKVEVLAAAVG
jgi:hypothetical protein